MPVKPVKMKDDLDRFYTKPDVAKSCTETLLKFCDPNDLFVEPSAGAGAFYLQLPDNKLGIDLSPAVEGVIEHDWLTYSVPDGCVIVGNPPFGHRNSLTKAFIKHSITAAKTVAFVLPCSYRKETTQKVFPSDWHLVSETLLPENSFLLEDKEYHVPCVFQVWANDSVAESLSLTDARESVKKKATTNDFTFSSKDDADFFIFGASPSKIIEKSLVKPNNRGYYIKQKSEDVVSNIKRIDWKAKANSSVSGGVAWYTKQEIINTYEDMKNETGKDSTKVGN